MQQFKNASLDPFIAQKDNYRTGSLKIDVSKPFQHKQIDTRWIQLKLNGKITPRSYFASCIQAGKVFIHGGYNEQKGILDDFMEAQFYDLPSQWAQIKVRSQNQKNPPPLRNHTICAYTSNLILFGGQKNMLQNNTNIYKFDLRTNQWQLVKTKFENNQKQNLSIDSHCAVIYNNNMYIYGGYESQKGIYSVVLYEVELKNLSNNQVTIREVQTKGGKSPKARGNFGSCLIQNELYIYGGTNSDRIFDDMWCYNFQQRLWRQITKQSKDSQWPQKRKGLTMVSHQKSKMIFLFGGIRQITKQQNDIMVFNILKSRWVKIHKNTNELYEPSPTVKKQVEESPSILDAKNRKQQKSRDEKSKQPFRLGVKSVTVYGKIHTEANYTSLKNNRISLQTQYGTGFGTSNFQSKRQMSVVQQKKYRQFLNRKKKLLSQVNKVTLQQFQKKRTHSPTSQTIIYSIDTIGEQKRSVQNFDQQLPKVIFDEQKGAVIGKKPCARDGHAALPYQDSMVIIGGDRHMMSFSDVYFFKMEKAIKSLHLYE